MIGFEFDQYVIDEDAGLSLDICIESSGFLPVDQDIGEVFMLNITTQPITASSKPRPSSNLARPDFSLHRRGSNTAKS